MNYFEFYEIPVKFNIDENALKSKYYSIARKNHPDFFINDIENKNNALQITSLNNEAFKCLSAFHSRVEYVLKLSNIEFNEKLSPTFLMEMMDINESIEELKIKLENDKFQNLKTEVEDMSNLFTDGLKSLTTKADEHSQIDKNIYIDIKEIMLKHKYILRLKETLANIAAHI
ncbi:MAG: Fe-S protein assembly co-chaperone HscB [Bacteroidia bacterium]|nr:Fe-S protein assembly co-chaperone HscB [Bacteroidia bacterium]